MAWNVPIQRPPGSRPRSRASRSRISPAALLVKVTARICQGATPRQQEVADIKAKAAADQEEYKKKSLGAKAFNKIVLDEGKNRHIRRLLGQLDVEVRKLRRVAIGR